MTCRCSTKEEHAQRAVESSEAALRDELTARQKELAARTPDADKFEIEDVEQVGAHLVLRIRYPNCAKCAYEGLKTIVVTDVTYKEALKWRRCDPHFRALMANSRALAPREMPSPAARFPGSSEGFAHAKSWAAFVQEKRTR